MDNRDFSNQNSNNEEVEILESNFGCLYLILFLINMICFIGHIVLRFIY